MKSDRRSSSETIDEGELMHCINSGIGMAENKTKEKTENTKNTSPYRRVSEATQHYAESPDPRDHIEQAIKAQQLTIKEHFDASNDNAM